MQRLDVHPAVPLAQPCRDGQRPRRVHPVPVGAVQHDAPVAELVAEPLHDQRPVVGHVAGRLPLVGEVLDHVPRGERVEPRFLELRDGLLVGQLRQLADLRADRLAELGGPARRVAVPERQLARLAGGGQHQHAVRRDVLDPPRAGAEHEHVADPRLVHHLFVELADPSRLLALRGRQEHPEQPPVRDRAAAGHRQLLRPWPAVDHAGHPVPDDPRPQAGELLARVPPGEHVEHRLEHRPGQPAERRRAPHQGLEVVHRPVVECRHRDDLLGEHVQRVARDPQLLDRAVVHPARDDGGLHQVTGVLGEDDPAGDVADVVPGPADPLQPAGHRRRRLDLDDQVDRAHVDAELEAGRGDHGGQPPGLERLLDLGPLLPGHRAVVRPRDRDWLVGVAGPFGGELVEPSAEPLGQPAGVGEHDRGPVLLDEVEHPLLDVRPDRPAPYRVVAAVFIGQPLRGLQVGHVLDGDDHLELDALRAGRAARP